MNIRMEQLRTIEPVTQRQQEAFEAYKSGNNLALVGTAGTGKTFLAMYFALVEILDKGTPYESLHIIRSAVPTREVGFLPGTIEEKLQAFTGPYRAVTADLFEDDRAYEKLVHNKYIEFESTSYIRGITFDDTIVLVEEMQNLNFHELDSIITRVGNNCRIIFCGDYRQTDFKYDDEKIGITKFLNITDQLKNFTTINFGWEDIVRSDFVRDYIMTKEMLGIE